MKSIGDIKLVNVFELASTGSIKEEAISFWLKHKALIKEDVLEQRSKELLFVAYDDKDNLIATSTYFKVRLKLLNNNYFYQYRCFIDPRFRVMGFDYHLTQKSLDALECVAKDDSDNPIGVVMIIENQNLYNNKINNAAVWRAYKMYFIGYSSKGDPIRVYYFKDAMI